MKKLLIAIIAFGFASTASAADLEVQISNSVSGTSSDVSIGIPDEGDTLTTYGLQSEVYYGLNENIQIGGHLGFAGSSADDSNFGYSIGVFGRYNLDTELRDSMFFGLGVVYGDNGSDGDFATTVQLAVQAGKRFALSDNLTYTPNVTFLANVAGDNDSGSAVVLNLISFSGFMSM